MTWERTRCEECKGSGLRDHRGPIRRPSLIRFDGVAIRDREEVQRRKDAERKARSKGIRDGSVLDFRAAFDRKTDG